MPRRSEAQAAGRNGGHEPVDHPLTREIERELDKIRPFLETHRGGVEVESIDQNGNVRVRFIGACEGCASQPVTFAARVAPVIERIAGVGSVVTEGRISSYALARIRKYFYDG